MIRLLLLLSLATFVLAVPHAAHALCATPPCTYSVTIQGAQSGVSNSPQQQTFTITSSSGPAAPPGAAAAGFTTLIVNLDFTGASTSYVGSGPRFNAAGSVSNYIDCEGASTPSLFNGNHGGSGPWPCVDSNGVHLYSIQADSGGGGGGATSLVITGTPQNSGAGGGGSSELYTSNPNPANFYVEYKVRTDAGSQAECDNGRNNLGAYVCQDIWAYTDRLGVDPVLEYDFGEYYQSAPNIDGGSNCGGCGQASGNATGGIEGHNWNSAPGIDVTLYAIYGERVTGDGNGRVAICWYYNNVQYAANGSPNCTTQDNSGNSNAVAALKTPLTFLIQDGHEPAALQANELLYFQFFRVWGCANWAQAGAPTWNGGVCATGLVTSNP